MKPIHFFCFLCVNMVAAQNQALTADEQKTPKSASNPSSQSSPSNTKANSKSNKTEKLIEEGLPGEDRLLIQRIKQSTLPGDLTTEAVYGRVDFERLLADGELTEVERFQLQDLEKQLDAATPLRRRLIEQKELVGRLKNRLEANRANADGTNPEKEVFDLILKVREAEKEYEPLKDRIKLSIQRLNGTGAFK